MGPEWRAGPRVALGPSPKRAWSGHQRQPEALWVWEGEHVITPGAEPRRRGRGPGWAGPMIDGRLPRPATRVPHFQPSVGVGLESLGEGGARGGGGGPRLRRARPRSRRRIVDRMDRAGDGDGWVSLAELRAWIAHTQQRHIRDSVSSAWNTYDTDRDGRVGWEELRNATYGHYEPGTWRDRTPAPHTHRDWDLFGIFILRSLSPLTRSLVFDL